MVQLGDEGLEEIFLQEASDEQLQYIHEPMKLILENYDCLINIRGTSNTRALSAVDPSRQQIVASLPQRIDGNLYGPFCLR